MLSLLVVNDLSTTTLRTIIPKKPGKMVGVGGSTVPDIQRLYLSHRFLTSLNSPYLRLLLYVMRLIIRAYIS